MYSIDAQLLYMFVPLEPIPMLVEQSTKKATHIIISQNPDYDDSNSYSLVRFVNQAPMLLHLKGECVDFGSKHEQLRFFVSVPQKVVSLCFQRLYHNPLFSQLNLLFIMNKIKKIIQYKSIKVILFYIPEAIE